MTTFKSSRLIVSVLLAALVALSTIAWAQRYQLPSRDDILIHINPPRHEQLNPHQIKILVWNLQKGVRDRWADDYHQLSEGKDILFLQEVLLDKNMGNVLHKHDEYTYQVAASFSDRWNDYSVSGVATASIASPVASSYLRSFHREPVIATPKMAVINEYLLAHKEKSLLTANIHAINFVSAEKHRHMLGELETILTTHEGPMILAGDFNTWSKDKTHSLKQLAKRLGLTEVVFADDHRTRIFGHALDWVFYRGLTVETAGVDASVTGSDHKPMEVAFSLSD